MYFKVLTQDLKSRVEKNNDLKASLEEEEKKNNKLKKDLEKLNEKSLKLAETIRNLETQVEIERVSQRNFNLAERTQRIQNHYTNLRGTMTSYYDQISNALPLLMVLGNGNGRLADIIPLLMGTIGEFNTGEAVTNSLSLVVRSAQRSER